MGRSLKHSQNRTSRSIAAVLSIVLATGLFAPAVHADEIGDGAGTSVDAAAIVGNDAASVTSGGGNTGGNGFGANAVGGNANGGDSTAGAANGGPATGGPVTSGSTSAKPAGQGQNQYRNRRPGRQSPSRVHNHVSHIYFDFCCRWRRRNAATGGTGASGFSAIGGDATGGTVRGGNATGGTGTGGKGGSAATRRAAMAAEATAAETL